MLKFEFTNINSTKAVVISFGVVYYFDNITDKRVAFNLGTRVISQRGKYFERMSNDEV